ncbi:MAG: RagB/SusD family nutrient uptake outer membrane protein, partial [Bacteroides sp.]
QSRVGYNIPLMRYANVLLMKAEALNELGQTAQAIPLINEVRSVHGAMPAMKGSTPADVKAQIEHERILEFPLENYRFYDLRRWGKAQEALTAAGRRFDAEKHSFYPTPLIELNANDKIGSN